MKIQCDVCNKEEAAVFCSADEAALCDGCDRRVHNANKLVSQHKRHSLRRHTFQDFPLCDICQEQRGWIFCKEDRAILCRECDLPIHKSNEHMQKHSRFLLTGVKISGSSSTHRAPSSSSTALDTSISTRTKEPPSSLKNENGQSAEFLNSSNARQDDTHIIDTSSFSTNSISEYFTEMLPGWRVDDFLDSPSAPIDSYYRG
ncbi:B-box zinc finger protein 20-like isoform X1 [Syzygium oleosum]|uniref:B-box zinc finger protein 20-like isoform X1 n=1 Tax=Syzygium oleosum TaxID=219896 RepID=UPI0024BAC213|nr:B-box zinc finger protein 20-like isoform X1 [Syzygium oleosum]